MPDLNEVYERRFLAESQGDKDRIWPEIVHYLERWIDSAAPVLDIACDRGYFIRNVRAAERWATDLRDVSAQLPADVCFVRSSGLELEAVLPAASFGTIS